MAETRKAHVHATIVSLKFLTDDIVQLELECPQISCCAEPGQFVAVRVGQTEAPLLRRPFSIAASDGERTIRLIFRILGIGTTLLAGKRPGERLDLIGPLGRPFEIHADRRAVLVAGGLGIPPIAFLARALKGHGITATLYYGVRTKAELAALDDAGDFVERLAVSTDEGSAGHHGPISELLDRDVVGQAISLSRAALYACGPRAMLGAVVRLACKGNVPAQVSFEQQMACGVGACMGCSIATAHGYKRVCTDGPVFPADIFFDQTDDANHD